MATLDLTMFETILPSRFLSFTIPNPNLRTQTLRVAVLDSPVNNDSSRVAALLVPRTRESDWIFSTESGHIQLLLASPDISRLILIGQNPVDGPDLPIIHDKDKDSQYVKDLMYVSKSIVIALSPKVNFGNFYIPFVDYEDNVVCSLVLEKCVGAFVGEMLVEDAEIELDGDCKKKEFRRRLRFKRMPNLVQTQIRIVPLSGCSNLDFVKIGETEFRPETRVLVIEYLIPMVASLSLIGSCIENLIRNGLKPRALCFGVAGGSLLSFLRTQLGFEVVGIEMDEEVLRIAKKYFGLDLSEIRVCLGNALEFLEKLGGQGNWGDVIRDMDGSDCCLIDSNGYVTKFDAVMVDLDASDARNGLSAPPLGLVKTEILLAIKSVLSDFGIVVVNVIAVDKSSYDSLVLKFRKIFCELYEIDVGDGDNFVLIAAASPVPSTVVSNNYENTFLEKIKLVIDGRYLDCIRRI